MVKDLGNDEYEFECDECGDSITVSIKNQLVQRSSLVHHVPTLLQHQAKLIGYKLHSDRTCECENCKEN